MNTFWEDEADERRRDMQQEDALDLYWRQGADKLKRMMDQNTLPWSVWWKPWRRCRAVKEPNASGFHGRCELDYQHNYMAEPYRDHALERGFAVPRWSTKWTN